MSILVYRLQQSPLVVFVLQRWDWGDGGSPGCNTTDPQPSKGLKLHWWLQTHNHVHSHMHTAAVLKPAEWVFLSSRSSCLSYWDQTNLRKDSAQKVLRTSGEHPHFFSSVTKTFELTKVLIIVQSCKILLEVWAFQSTLSVFLCWKSPDEQKNHFTVDYWHTAKNIAKCFLS